MSMSDKCSSADDALSEFKADIDKITRVGIFFNCNN